MTKDWMDQIIGEELHKPINVPKSLNQVILTRVKTQEEKKEMDPWITGLLLLGLGYQVGLYGPILASLKHFLTPGRLLGLGYLYLVFSAWALTLSLVLVTNFRKGEI